MKKLNQKGFTTIEILLIVLVVTVVVSIGYFAYQRANNTNQISSTNPEASATGYATLVYGQEIGTIVQGCRAGSNVNSGVGIRIRGNKPAMTAVILRKAASPNRPLSSGKFLRANTNGSWVTSVPLVRPTDRQQASANPLVYANLNGFDSAGKWKTYPSSNVRYRSLPRC